MEDYSKMKVSYPITETKNQLIYAGVTKETIYPKWSIPLNLN